MEETRQPADTESPPQAPRMPEARTPGHQAGLLAEFGLFLRERKLLWLTPIFLVLGLLGGLLIFSASSPLAPFIYAIF
ncbi:MAG: hypothetical protein KC466_09970 [Myxococcales bacterium]|nr:hypothetical protein [Myxococcales bacterium]